MSLELLLPPRASDAFGGNSALSHLRLKLKYQVSQGIEDPKWFMVALASALAVVPTQEPYASMPDISDAYRSIVRGIVSSIRRASRLC